MTQSITMVLTLWTLDYKVWTKNAHFSVLRSSYNDRPVPPLESLNEVLWPLSMSSAQTVANHKNPADSSASYE